MFRLCLNSYSCFNIRIYRIRWFDFFYILLMRCLVKFPRSLTNPISFKINDHVSLSNNSKICKIKMVWLFSFTGGCGSIRILVGFFFDFFKGASHYWDWLQKILEPHFNWGLKVRYNSHKKQIYFLVFFRLLDPMGCSGNIV